MFTFLFLLLLSLTSFAGVKAFVLVFSPSKGGQPPAGVLSEVRAEAEGGSGRVYTDDNGWKLVAVFPGSYDVASIPEINAKREVLRPFSADGRFGYIDDEAWAALKDSIEIGLKLYISRAVRLPRETDTIASSFSIVWPKTNRMSYLSFFSLSFLDPFTWPAYDSIEGLG